MTRFRAVLLALATAGFAAYGGGAIAQTVAKLVLAQSEIGFTSKQMGVPVSGQFKRFDAQVQLDPKKPEAGRVSLTVDLTSVSLGGPQFEDELAKPTWFDSKKAASANFQSSAIKAAGPGRFEVAGKLSLKGASRDLVIPVTLAPAGANSVATGSFVVKRLDYKIGDGDWSDTSMVANDVQVNFKLVLSGMPAS